MQCACLWWDELTLRVHCPELDLQIFAELEREAMRQDEADSAAEAATSAAIDANLNDLAKVPWVPTLVRARCLNTDHSVALLNMHSSHDKMHGVGGRDHFASAIS